MLTVQQRAKAVFLSALERPATDRGAFVDEVCAGDEGLRREVDSLLSAHDSGNSSTAAEPPPQAMFTAGEMFAGRYRMISRIGRGGMGEVWRADDLVLHEAVALKLLYSTVLEARERILNEVRLARQITHPSICRVFDVGEADGWIFYSMELVEGEDLASLIRRVGRLPSEKVIDIGVQLCGGLAAAHAQGVLHRDLKPANVLIDNNGSVRITDFGIAISRRRRDRHTLTGTPAYMAPEQRSLGVSLSEQTDIYSLGLVLYELLVGRHPLGGTRSPIVPPAPSTVVPNVHPQLEPVVMQALALDPEQRPHSAAAMGTRLEEIRARTTGTGAILAGQHADTAWHASRWLAGGALAVFIGILAVAPSYFSASSASRLSAQDAIVLSDFDNQTGDPVFDRALGVALAVALEQSPFLKVFSGDQARDTLRLMERPPDEPITPPVAREIARREQLKAFVAGSISSLGRNYVLALEAINADTGDVMAREQVEAESKEAVLASLGTATSRLREKLGESLASIKEFDVPLPRATTSSLEALHAYSLALEGGREVPRLESLPHLQRAIELDPDFAMAHAQLSAVYANTGQSGLAPAYSKKAFELRDRVSERERFFISWRYYRDAVQAWDKALELARSWTAAYPREAVAFNALGAALLRLGHYEESIAALREAIRLDPEFTPAYSNMAASYLALQRLTEARGILREAADRKLQFAGAQRLSYLVAFVEGDEETMSREMATSVGVGETNAAFGWQAVTHAFRGQIAAAHDQFQRGFQMSQQGQFDEVAAQLSVEDAEVHALVGQCVEAREEVATGLALSRDSATLQSASRALALCGRPTEASGLAEEFVRQFPDATITIRVGVPVTNAAIAVAQRQPERALAMLEPVRPYDHTPSPAFWPSYLRGQAYLQLGQAKEASTEFAHILEHRGEGPASILYPLARLGFARAAALMNDREAADEAYADFFALWNAADPDLQPIRDARQEQARLQP